MTPIPLQEWFNTWLDTTDKDLNHLGAAKAQVMFVRDDLTKALAVTYEEWRAIGDSLVVVAEHHSKSVRLPIYQVQAGGRTYRIGCNFHFWYVSVEGDEPVNLPPLPRPLFDPVRQCLKDPCDCYGFAPEWVYGPFAANRRRFTIHVDDQYELYTLLRLIAGRLP